MVEDVNAAMKAAPKGAKMAAWGGRRASRASLVGSYTPKNSADAGNENNVAAMGTKGQSRRGLLFAVVWVCVIIVVVVVEEVVEEEVVCVLRVGHYTD
eukprot:1176072-Prorocentrum_minimum.AAC.3